MYLVMAGGDGFQSTIVPESKLDDAYLRTQWWTILPEDAEAHAEALVHFHDDGEWTHTDPSGSGERLEFSVFFEDGWVRVIRLFDTSARATPPAQAPARPQALTADQVIAEWSRPCYSPDIHIASAFEAGVRFAEREHGITGDTNHG